MNNKAGTGLGVSVSPSAKTAAEAIRVEGLRKSFGPHEVLKGVDLTAHEGDVIAVIGGSGSGKSTMLRCINFLETPSAGRIVIAGEEVRQRPDGGGAADRRQIERIRRSLGMVFQSFNLWTHKTVLDNLIEVPVHVLGVPKAEAVERARMLPGWDWRKRRTATPPSCPVASSSARPSRGRCASNPARCCLTNRPLPLTPNWWARGAGRDPKGLAAEGRTMILVTHEMKFARRWQAMSSSSPMGRSKNKARPNRCLADRNRHACNNSKPNT